MPKRLFHNDPTVRRGHAKTVQPFDQIPKKRRSHREIECPHIAIAQLGAQLFPTAIALGIGLYVMDAIQKRRQLVGLFCLAATEFRNRVRHHLAVLRVRHLAARRTDDL